MGKTAGDMRSCPAKDMIVKVGSTCTHVSELILSVARGNFSETDTIYVAKIMVEALGML